MDALSSFFGSQSSSRNRWSYDSLKNLGQISPAVQTHLKQKSSRVSSNYMALQFDINEKMRAILIDWFIEVHYKFQLMEETLFLTVNLVDRFLERQTVPRKKLQLVGGDIHAFGLQV
ncbi:hypothetical protein FH972_005203 [Carpinus fangiana]|uniref:B-like cyclin n=1 Tax=Carpinus fangiana TaxID=176857 RepID=A0A5N6QNX2_9ROSI|nr:hypothetical protein FH972_005203 [Carpinus fangiana]